MKKMKPWHLPTEHPVRIWWEFNSARVGLRLARASAEEDCDELGAGVSMQRIADAEARYARKREAWELAGMPDRDGRRQKETSKP